MKKLSVNYIKLYRPIRLDVRFIEDLFSQQLMQLPMERRLKENI
jgi:hypothetical protein